MPQARGVHFGMTSCTRLRRESCLLLVVDVQSRLAPAVFGQERVISRSRALVDAATLLGVPAYASEHVPESIGPLVDALRGPLPEDHVLRKTHFSCADEPTLLMALRSARRPQVLLTGMEAHVCVMQSALGLAARGLEVYVARDAVGSRREEDRETALARLAQAGVRIVTAEMAMFEWMHRADAPELRELLRIVKAL
jgi:nicotinamidase-related amidase